MYFFIFLVFRQDRQFVLHIHVKFLNYEYEYGYLMARESSLVTPLADITDS